MTDNSILYLIKHYFKLCLYLAGNFGIFCFTAQSVPALTETPVAPNYEQVMTDEAVLTATEYNTATSESTTSAASEPIPATTTQMVQAHEVTALQDQTALTDASTEQVTSVSQLSDVQPTDWAFQALQSLVERYSLVVGYPNSAYRGNRAMTRYEFAAGLNVVLEQVNELIRTGVVDQVSRDDLITLQRLQEEFAAELATLQGRVDTLEASAATLEANQFSTHISH